MKNSGLALVRGCASPGCTAEAYRNGPWCLKCKEQIEDLSIWENRQEMSEILAELRRQDWRDRVRRVASWAAKWRFIPELVLVVGGLMYLGATFGAAWLQWLGWR